MTTSEILTFVAEIVKSLIDVGIEAARGPEPPSLTELDARIRAAISQRRDDWFARLQAEAAGAEQQAAVDAMNKKG